MRDLVVIGGGTGGLIVTSVAAQLGLKVTLVERREKLGGDCLHTGCVPSKSLIRVAKVASLLRRAADFGLDAHLDKTDLGKVSDYVHSIISQIQQHDDPDRFRSYGADVIFGHARFIDSHSIEVNGELLRGKRFVIATGSSPYIPPVMGMEDVPYLTNESIFSQRKLPARLAVLGGGAVGVELAQAYARLGSEVTLVERLAQLLPHEDREISDLLAELLRQEGLSISLSSDVTRVEQQDKECRLHITTADREQQLDVDAVLIAAGRRPNVEELGLDAASVNYSAKGIIVDRRQRTSASHIYACGDVCGPYPFTHMAEYQAGIVISNAIFRFPKKTDYRVVPWVTFSDPELARVGITEQQAKDQGLDVDVLSFPMNRIDRALADSESTGIMKLVSHKEKILGATILGSHAGELIHEISLAMQKKLKLKDISATIHAYPTLAQVHRRTANSYYADKLFSPRTRKLVGWINRILP